MENSIKVGWWGRHPIDFPLDFLIQSWCLQAMVTFSRGKHSFPYDPRFSTWVNKCRQIVLESLPGNIFKCAEEYLNMRTPPLTKQISSGEGKNISGASLYIIQAGPSSALTGAGTEFHLI